MVGFFLDMIFGKIDKNAIFDGMSGLERRFKGKREDFLIKKRDIHKRNFDIAVREFYKDGMAPEDIEGKCAASYQRYSFLHLFYDDAYRNLGNFSEVAFLKAFFRSYPHNFNINGEHWKKVIALLSEEAAVRENVPSLFNGKDKIIWDEHLQERLEREKAHQLRQQRKKNVKDLIDSMESEIGRLKSMFYAASGFTRTRLSVSIDVAEQNLSRLKNEMDSLK